MKNLNSDLSIVNMALETAEPVLSAYIPDKLQEYLAFWEEKTGGAHKATIMMYGMYSHGKSTIVNALLGKEAAQVGIAPTTDSIHTYAWDAGNCALLDTPGIQARDKDSALAVDTLQKCELVAFIVESGDVEAALIWRELVQMIQRGQKVCLIINDFDGIIGQQEKLMALKDMYRQHLQAEAASLGYTGDIVGQVPMLIVNAKLALKGKLRGNPALVQASGLIDVEAAIVRMAASFELSDTARLLGRQLSALLGICRSKIAMAGGETTLAAMEEKLASIQMERDRAYGAIETYLDNALAKQTLPLHDMYATCTDKDLLQQTFSNIVCALINDISNAIQQEMTRSAGRIDSLVKDFQQIHTDLRPDSTLTEDQEAPGDFDKLPAIDINQLLTGVDIETLIQTTVIECLKQLKTWFPTLLKGKGPATFARWAGITAKVLNIAIAIGTALWQAYDEYRTEQKALEAAQRKNQAIADAVTNTRQELHRTLLMQIDNIFMQTFDPLIIKMANSLAQERKKDTMNKAQLTSLGEAERILQAT